MDRKTSGKFVLRLPPELHLSLKNLAARKGISLNELCLRAVKSYITGIRADTSSGGSKDQRWFRVLEEQLGNSLLGVILFGSVARGENRGSSDVDLLIVVSSDLPLNRRLYAMWDEKLSEEPHSPHFVHLAETVSRAGSLWYEAAVDGIVLHETDGKISRFLSRIRRLIASGKLERKIAYGHPYWVKREEETGVQ
ncbi:MAG: toxin-antitoxin system HicB family antitoxin [Spirochaetales bacterium]|nr:toxin-antitoxin system HicB family antitoxin [Spirochaetales bacterium]